VLYRYCVHGRKGIEMHAISALDCALWDSRAAISVSRYTCCWRPGAGHHPAYASALGYSLDLDRARERAAELAAQGFTAMKWFPRHGPVDGKVGMAANVALIAALREAVARTWTSWWTPGCPGTCPTRCAWPTGSPSTRPAGSRTVLPDRPHSYAEITRRIRGDIQVSGAEHEYTRWGIHQLMAAEAMHIYQPDTYWAGGISEMCKIAALASTYDVQLIRTATRAGERPLQLRPAGHADPLVEYLVKWNVINQWFLKHPVHPVNGQLLPPTEPGLGMDLDPDKIEQRRELTFRDRERPLGQPADLPASAETQAEPNNRAGREMAKTLRELWDGTDATIGGGVPSPARSPRS